jgi:dimethylamine monooxygenase subunit A
VAPGLRPLSTDYGNGAADRRILQIDEDFPRYRANKEACFAEYRAKYWLTHDLTREVAVAAARAIGWHLSNDFPDYYESNEGSLESLITGERVVWTEAGLLDRVSSRLPDGVDQLLEAMAFQIQADLAVVVREPDGGDRIAALHLCSPSHWAGGDKIGRSFFETHAPVPAFDAVNAVAAKLVKTIIEAGPFVRFVWGVESDDRLNHHPSAPPGWDQEEWWGRRFDRGRFWVRTERQTILGLPDVDAALFFIHVQTLPDSEVLADEEMRSALLSGLLSMSPEARAYKGVERHFDPLIGLLKP